MVLYLHLQDPNSVIAVHADGLVSKGAMPSAGAVTNYKLDILSLKILRLSMIGSDYYRPDVVIQNGSQVIKKSRATSSVSIQTWYEIQIHIHFPQKNLETHRVKLIYTFVMTII